MSPFTDDRKTPDLDHINTDEYNTYSKLILLFITNYTTSKYLSDKGLFQVCYIYHI